MLSPLSAVESWLEIADGRLATSSSLLSSVAVATPLVCSPADSSSVIVFLIVKIAMAPSPRRESWRSPTSLLDRRTEGYHPLWCRHCPCGGWQKPRRQKSVNT